MKLLIIIVKKLLIKISFNVNFVGRVEESFVQGEGQHQWGVSSPFAAYGQDEEENPTDVYFFGL
ncbi:MAG: hypothetical protein F6K24_08990 [Okeania sp. SIO2D1]|nr:hypothetical protein [Okeania sp. SIO2D1]